MADDQLAAERAASQAPPNGDGTIESVDLLAAHQSGDHVLAMYIAAFNADPTSHMPITVFSGGYAFSGRLVGASMYFDAVADRADNDAISIPFRKMAEDYRNEPADDMPLVTTYVHMLDVSVFGGAERLGKLKAWRGRLSQISGWTTERIKSKG